MRRPRKLARDLDEHPERQAPFTHPLRRRARCHCAACWTPPPPTRGPKPRPPRAAGAFACLALRVGVVLLFRLLSLCKTSASMRLVLVLAFSVAKLVAFYQFTGLSNAAIHDRFASRRILAEVLHRGARATPCVPACIPSRSASRLASCRALRPNLHPALFPCFALQVLPSVGANSLMYVT